MSWWVNWYWCVKLVVSAFKHGGSNSVFLFFPLKWLQAVVKYDLDMIVSQVKSCDVRIFTVSGKHWLRNVCFRDVDIRLAEQTAAGHWVVRAGAISISFCWRNYHSICYDSHVDTGQSDNLACTTTHSSRPLAKICSMTMMEIKPMRLGNNNVWCEF